MLSKKNRRKAGARRLKGIAACFDFGARLAQGNRRRGVAKWALSQDLESSQASQGVAQGLGARGGARGGARFCRRHPPRRKGLAQGVAQGRRKALAQGVAQGPWRKGYQG